MTLQTPEIAASSADASDHETWLGQVDASALPDGFEEDDDLRSDFVRDLALRQLRCLRDRSDGSGAQGLMPIPRTLMQYWHDPVSVPPDVRECMDSWSRLRDEGFVLRTFGDSSASDYIWNQYGPREQAAFARCRHPAMRSDYFRMCFVLAEGGLYVDADDVLLGDGWERIFHNNTLKLHPLGYDLGTNAMIPSLDLLRTDLSTGNRIFYVNNNPMAGPAGHPILRGSLARATDRLLGGDSSLEIQSTTGPGNITTVLAAHARSLRISGTVPDYELLFDWDRTAEPRWDLCYRQDDRNWRNMRND